MRFTDALGVKYAIWFKYTLHDAMRETVCVIDIEGSDKTFATGSAVCAKSDRFEKAKGRELALVRALKDAITRQGKRDDFWRAAMQCYLKRGEKKEVKIARN